MTEFALRIADGWAGRIPEAAAALTAAGAEITQIVPDRRVLVGVIESWFLSNLSGLPCTDGIVEGASYVVDADGRHVHRPRRPERTAPAHPCDNTASGRHPGSKGPSRANGHGPRDVSTRPVDLLDLVQDDPTPTQDRPHDTEQTEDPQITYDRGPFETVDWPAPEDATLQERVLDIPWSARFGYSAVAILALFLIVHTALQGQDHQGCVLLAQVCASALLFALSTTAALGLCRYRPVCRACTVLALLVTLLGCVPWDNVSLARVVAGLAAFLIAGMTNDSLWSS